MKKALLILLLAVSATTYGQSKLASQDISVNGFRNPSIGLEYRYHRFSAHAGYYLTNFTSGVTTRFVKTGVTFWFGALGKKPIPSSFYASASYLRGLSRDYEGKNAYVGEVGFRWMVWKGLNLRIGVAALAANGESLKINPTPGISYTFLLKGKQPKAN